MVTSGPERNRSGFGFRRESESKLELDLSLFESENTLAGIEEKGAYLERELTKIPWIQEVRRVGLILGFDVGECGKEFCLKLRERGVLTRPILNTIVIMPPLSATMDELKILVKAIKL